MSKEEKQTITFSEPIISYSPSYNYSSETSGKDKNSTSILFTPIWNSNNIKQSFSQEKLQKPKSITTIKSTFSHQSAGNTSYFRVNNVQEIQRNTGNRNKTEKFYHRKDLSNVYDELIEKLKRNPPNIKNSFDHENYINKIHNQENESENIQIINVPNEDNQFSKQSDMRIKEEKNSKKINFNHNDLNNKKIKNELNNKNNKKEKELEKEKEKKKEKEKENYDKKQLYQTNKFLFKPEEKVKNLTNTEDINDFYEYTERCMEMILDLDKSKQVQIKEKINLNFPKDEIKKRKKIALFDLDETLAHCIGEIKENQKPTKPYKHIVEVTLPSKKQTKIGINIRPNWEETMELIKDKYNIVIYTASHQSYADAVLNYMDPEKKYTKYRLYRNNCVQANVDGKKFYVKDLSIFDKYYNLKDIVIVDNSVLSFAYHLNNGIPIVPYYDSDEDSELTILGYYLFSIYKYDDLREANKEHIRIGYYLEKARNEREEEEEEDDEIKEENEDKKMYSYKTERNSINYISTQNVIDDNSKIKTEVEKNNKGKNIKIINMKKTERVNKKSYDRSNTIVKKFGGLSPEKKIPKRKKTYIGLNIVNIWKGIRQEMNTVNY